MQEYKPKQGKKICGTQKSNLGPLGSDESPQREVLTTILVPRERSNGDVQQYESTLYVQPVTPCQVGQVRSGQGSGSRFDKMDRARLSDRVLGYGDHYNPTPKS
jgi:hypothetical protein